MLKEERHKKIISLLKEKKILSTIEVANLLHSSVATVRRDFSYLENKGEIVRVHGGCQLVKMSNEEFSFSDKLTYNIKSKKKIGQIAASFVENQTSIYLDAGTTTLQMIDFLPKNVEVITNSVHIALKSLEENLKTILLGGHIKKSTDAMIGSITLNQIKQFHFNFSFIGINGVSEKFGYTTPDPEESNIKQQVLKQSEQSYFLADKSKTGKSFLIKVAELSSYPLITENSSKMNKKE
ncbi:DeoR/GlpR family DNA-binding transcription regulator [Xylocopilactobacillus apis]|uniref:DeoR family transcriptional regulator n=1 Tax=Xylocopilactobacillus apis TaxID=2932183 RepID=A0AAU9D078_9LACO|nr:DeoR/GlpR family DNA-binding transcription regulator [Xylocopilactobacillus apis]BDR56938.1 DeoR family transcriptional regulator [Xylocopilactobacillus apis]